MSTANDIRAVSWEAGLQFIVRMAALAAVSTVLSGCGGVEEAKLDDYLESLEFSTPLESLREVKLGTYRVSSATRKQEASQIDTQRTWVQVSCELYVVVAEEDELNVVDAYNRHKGVFDDTIVQILRSSTIDELSDPRWSTIKARLSDFARPVLGGERIRQIVINDYGWEPI